MEQHPLTNEKTFTKWLSKLSCNGCLFFIDKKCTHEKAIENEEDKPFLIEHAIKKGDAFSIEWAENINDHFVCTNYKSKHFDDNLTKNERLFR